MSIQVATARQSVVFSYDHVDRHCSRPARTFGSELSSCQCKFVYAAIVNEVHLLSCYCSSKFYVFSLRVSLVYFYQTLWVSLV